MSSRILAHRLTRSCRPFHRLDLLIRGKATVATPSEAFTAGSKSQRHLGWMLAGGLVAATALRSSHLSLSDSSTSLDAIVMFPLRPATIEMDIEERRPEDVTDSSTTTATTTSSSSAMTEPDTGINFPAVLDSKQLFGVGCRKKYSILNVYALGLYADPDDFSGVKHDQKEAALLDPEKHRILRIVLNRKLTMDTVISALMEAIEPRMHGEDLWALDEFSKLRDYGHLQFGDEIILTIRGDSLHCKCSNGGESVLRSKAFTKAVCDVYFGKDSISPAAKTSVMSGMSQLCE